MSYSSTRSGAQALCQTQNELSSQRTDKSRTATSSGFSQWMWARSLHNTAVLLALTISACIVVPAV